MGSMGPGGQCDNTLGGCTKGKLLKTTYQDYRVEEVANNVIEEPVVGKGTMAAVMAENKYRPHHCSLQEPVYRVNG